MPTSPIVTYGVGRVDPIKNAEDARLEVKALKASTTFAAGTLIGEVTSPGGVYGPYASGNSDGTQNPTHILQYACVTDASGNVTFGAGPAGTSEWSQTEKGAPAYRGGVFRTEDLVGLDANAVTKLGRLLQGTVSSGELSMYGS